MVARLPRALEFRRTTIIIAGLATFLAGLGLAYYGVALSFWWAGLGGLLILVTHKKRSLLLLGSVLVFGLTLGLWRGGVYQNRLQPLKDLFGKYVVLKVQADNDSVYSAKSQLSFDGSHLQVVEPYKTFVTGKLNVAGFGESMVYRGDVVRVEGKLFPSRGSHQARISFADLQIVSRGKSKANTALRNFSAGLQSALPEPQASFGLGLLVGQRSTIPKDTNDLLARVGLTHIVAVSGYNLTIIVNAVRRLLGKRSKYQSTIISLGLIGLFLLFTGLSASIVRAAVVSTLSLAAWYYGRKIRPILLVLLAAALTAGWNPLYLWGDVGWYLSFLAFFGILVLGPLLIQRFSKKVRTHPLVLLTVESMAAQIMTLPLLMFVFGQLSLVSLPANLLAVPLIPLAMLLTLAAGVSGWLVPTIAGWIAWPARLLLTYILDMASLVSRIPHGFIAYTLRAWQLSVVYGLLALICLLLWLKVPKKVKITESKQV